MDKKEKLATSILRLSQHKGTLYISDIEAEVINFVCVELFKNHKTEISDYIEYSKVYTNIAKELVKEYDDSYASVAQMSVIQNMQWPGMKSFLKEYYQKNHNLTISL